jgi:hypothetical protein
MIKEILFSDWKITKTVSLVRSDTWAVAVAILLFSLGIANNIQDKQTRTSITEQPVASEIRLASYTTSYIPISKPLSSPLTKEEERIARTAAEQLVGTLPKKKVAVVKKDPFAGYTRVADIPKKPKNPNSIRIHISEAPILTSKVKWVNGKGVCLKKDDNPQKSEVNKKGHIDRQCCLDPDEIPNPRCLYK